MREISKKRPATWREYRRLSYLVLGVSCFVLAQAEPAFAAPGWWSGVDTPPFAGGVVRRAFCDLAWFIEGTFGGMVMSAAGAVAIAAAAMGSLKQMQSLMIAGIGAVTITAGVSLYFGNFSFGCANNLNSPSGVQSTTRLAPTAAAIAIATGRELPSTESDDEELPQDAESEDASESDGDPFSD